MIVGGGKLPDAARDEFFKLAGGMEKAKIVVIPTASADADKPDQAESFTKQWANLKPVSVTLLHTRDRKTADNPEFVEPLWNAAAKPVRPPGASKVAITSIPCPSSALIGAGQSLACAPRLRSSREKKSPMNERNRVGMEEFV